MTPAITPTTDMSLFTLLSGASLPVQMVMAVAADFAGVLVVYLYQGIHHQPRR